MTTAGWWQPWKPLLFHDNANARGGHWHTLSSVRIGYNSKNGECCVLKGNIEERAVELAQYIIENRATVRAAAAQFGISKSTVHKDLSERLPRLNRALYIQAKAVLDDNKAERHIRGGIATRRKYKGE